MTNMPIQLRTGEAADAAAIHELITTNLSVGHLLPRTFEDIESHVQRFVVAVSDEGTVVGCGELAPLSGEVAEVRSLVVDAARERRLLINRTSDTVIRLLPPYVITERDIDEALPLLEAAIGAVVEASDK